VLPVIDEALRRAGVALRDIDAVAVANTPGLAGSLLVGLVAAKAICLARGIPLVAVNHLQAHVYACRLAAGRDVFPCVGLIVSGGHTSLYRCRNPLDFEFLGGTIDDAAGEAFDKVAAMLGLPYPGGPHVDRLAAGGDRSRVPLPRAWLGDSLDFSFSGLKTAVRNFVAKDQGRTPAPDIAAGLQAAIVDVLTEKLRAAARRTGIRTVCVAGGVAANRGLKASLEAMANEEGLRLVIPPPELCTDNAAMIAAAGFFSLQRKGPDGLDFDTLATAPLEYEAI